MGWSLLHKLDSSLFPQMIVVPLMRDHRILTQTSGKAQDIIKLLPPMIMSDADIDWFLAAFEETLKLAHQFPGGVWDLGKSLAKAAMGDRAAGAEQRSQ
jgi:ornithine--oxo-acid transaminase